MVPKLFKLIGLMVIAALFLTVAVYLRSSLDIEMSQASLREWVLSAGAAAPVIAILLVSFRSLIGIPSHLVLVVMGLCFGTALGTLYGAIGLTITGALVFVITRYSGRNLVQNSMPDRFTQMLKSAGNRAGASVVGFMTAYPLGPLTPVHSIAGVTSMRFILFVSVVFFSALVRAACYSYFGSNLVVGGIRPVLEATAVMVLVLCLPLAFPKGRSWVKRWIFSKES